MVPDLWRSVDMEDGQDSNRLARNKGRDALCAMATVAVDRSGGSLEMFAGKNFVTDKLLKYIGDRAPVLKSIRITSCDRVSDIGLAEAIVGKSSLLEELHISYCRRVYGYTLDRIGKACPHLKRFALTRGTSVEYWGFAQYNEIEGVILVDDDADGIAAMHGLRSLQLASSWLTNAGLTAILDNCPDLAYLELRACDKVRMDGDMRSKCARIKTLIIVDEASDSVPQAEGFSYVFT